MMGAAGVTEQNGVTVASRQTWRKERTSLAPGHGVVPCFVPRPPGSARYALRRLQHDLFLSHTSTATLTIAIVMPALMCYERSTDIGSGIGVNVVAFSPDGQLLATGGKESKLCIWRVSDGKLFHTFITPSDIFSLVWVPDEEGVLVCGMEDGTLLSVLIQPVCLPTIRAMPSSTDIITSPEYKHEAFPGIMKLSSSD